jgi:diguanylate cyclase (GGDEF)-like protein
MNTDKNAAYAMLRGLLQDTGEHTGHAFCRSATRALCQHCAADLCFIALLLPDQRTVRVLMGWNGATDLSSFEFPLTGTPCDLLYAEGDLPWSATRIDHAVAVSADLCRQFDGARQTDFESFIGVPLFDAGQRIIGHLALFYRRSLAALAGDRDLVEITALFGFKVQAELCRMLLENEQQQAMLALREANARLEVEAVTDGLTTLYNRRHFNQAIHQEFMRFQRSGRPFALILLDLDRFKRINDELGHDVGDEVLQRVATQLLGATRQGVEVVCRIGGEEFAVLCHDLATEAALAALCRRLHDAIGALHLSACGRAILTSVSIGAAIVETGDLSWQNLYKRADNALYGAKDAGRNRVVLAPHAAAVAGGR